MSDRAAPRAAPLWPFMAAMGAVVLASNILVQIRLGDWLTWGALTYPFAFLVTDLANRLHGPGAARRVVLAGFALGLALSGLGTVLPGPDGPLVTPRVALASAAAFLVAQLLDVAVFDRLRGGAWWRAPLASSTLGSAIDTALFFAIAFSAALAFPPGWGAVDWANAPAPLLGRGPEAALWVSLALADFAVKLAIAAVALIPFRLMTARAAG